MSTRIFGCRKFGRLLNEEGDRELRPREERFLAKHREVCPSCRREEMASKTVLNMLRGAKLDADEVSTNFDDRVLRRLRVQTVRESLGYWSPALLGGLIACIALFAVLRLLAQSPTVSKIDYPAGTAQRTTHSAPSMTLTRIPRFDR